MALEQVLIRRLVDSRTGRAFIAIRENENPAETLGTIVSKRPAGTCRAVLKKHPPSCA